MKTVFVSSLCYDTDERVVVARLDFDGTWYHYSYTRGVLRAMYLLPFDCKAKVQHVQYWPELPPRIAVRRMRKSRSEYPRFLAWMGLDAPDAMAELGISGGIKATDSFQTMPLPERTPEGQYVTDFFTRGLWQAGLPSVDAARRLATGDRLWLIKDPLSPWCSYKLFADPDGRGPYVGYLPRLFATDIARLLDRCGSAVEVRVRQVNQDAPTVMMVLCRLTSPWPDGFLPFDGQDDFVSLASPDPAECTDEGCIECAFHRQQAAYKRGHEETAISA
ncbi:hypothetical protein CUPL110328_12215 [Cupriavidus plantarum]|nr:hypothetical protein LMG26296_01133 [Cupriavidus plantarum]SMR66737.1 hypothetical protein SAMN05421735_1623 [Cupriavidus plantarum]